MLKNAIYFGNTIKYIGYVHKFTYMYIFDHILKRRINMEKIIKILEFIKDILNKNETNAFEDLKKKDRQAIFNFVEENLELYSDRDRDRSSVFIEQNEFNKEESKKLDLTEFELIFFGECGDFDDVKSNPEQLYLDYDQNKNTLEICNLLLQKLSQPLRIVNLTPHNINIISQESCVFEPEFRKWITEDPQITKTIPSSGMVSAKINSVISGNINGIPKYDKEIIGLDHLPEGYDIYIVSAIYAVAAQKAGVNNEIYVITEPVFDMDGKTVLGCLGISKAF